MSALIQSKAGAAMRGAWALALGLAGAAGCAGAGEAGPLAAAPGAGAAARVEAPAPPEAPAGLVHFFVGDLADAVVTPAGPALVVAGGGADVDAAMRALTDVAAGGDVVVLRATGGGGYGPYLFRELGGVDSVETLVVDAPRWAEDPYVIDRINGAEAIFIAGGDQWDYLSTWGGPVQAALQAAWARGAAIGGTSAGAAILGQRAFSAARGTVTSPEALRRPFRPRLRFVDRFLCLPPLTGVLTDTHFSERDRLGRLLTFLARAWGAPTAGPMEGWGVDEGTAAVWRADTWTVRGAGAVWRLRPTAAPDALRRGAPLRWMGVPARRVVAGEAWEGPDTHLLDAEDGALRVRAR
ncbi:MAG: cyanophycinase [Deltaproteobacteria bacterium]|nr:cyanophycinase [Deltaproteobacteria bacterium]